MEVALIKKIPNIITFSRILCAILLLNVKAFSVAFWLLYLYSGISDVADGLLARKLNLESDTGAKLDSIADFAFLSAIVIVIVLNITIPGWVWICVGIIGFTRLAAYGIGYLKYHTYSALHTYMNKITGMLLFVMPLLCLILDIRILTVFLCLIAFVSSSEELLITLKSRELNPNCKTILNK